MKKISLKSFWSVAILALAVLVVWGVGAKVLMPVYAADPACYYDFDLWTTCDINAQCNDTTCLCWGTAITVNSGQYCSLCAFSGNQYLNWQTTTGYKYSSLQFGSCTDIGNYTGIICNANPTSFFRTPTEFNYSSCNITPPAEWYCSDWDPDLGMACKDKQRCNTPGWCRCQSTSTWYTSQCHWTCSSSTKIISGHIYTLSGLWYGSNLTWTTGMSITGGTITYTQIFTCSTGDFFTIGSEWWSVSCNAWYDIAWNTCVLHQSWGGGWGGGGYISTCGFSDLMCVNNSYQRKPGVSCQWGDLAKVCGTGIITTGNTVPLTGSIFGSPYSIELNNAYLRSYANGITTMDTIQKANMTSHLLRAHMAKMISNFAIRLGGLTPNTGKQCSFDDIASQSTEMKFYIKLACQLGLMWVGVDSFDPKGEISRADFGTILSRVIRGTRYNGGTPYYAAHLNALKNAGIMTQISTPKMKELRWYVMLMLERTYEGGFLTGN